MTVLNHGSIVSYFNYFINMLSVATHNIYYTVRMLRYLKEHAGRPQHHREDGQRVHGRALRSQHARPVKHMWTHCAHYIQSIFVEELMELLFLDYFHLFPDLI